jgi:predicted PurR-regulated permease PerM
MNKPDNQTTPNWGSTTKLVVALTLVAFAGFLVVKFQNILGPLLLAFILSYLVHPIAAILRKWVRLPWRLAVTLIYLVFIVAILSLLTVGGFALFGQIQSLINFVQQTLVTLPQTIENLQHQVFTIGPFKFGLANLGEIGPITNQVLSYVNPVLGELGGLVGRIAASAANLIGWIFFILIVSYFILVESEGVPGRLIDLKLPGYDADLRRMGHELGRIWDAFLRGQLIVFIITILVYLFLLTVLGVHYALGLAILAGLAKFIPYIGPFIAWTTYGLVAFFAGTPPFGLTPLAYSLIVVGIALVVDNAFDNLVSPRIIADALKVHPAAVLVAALIGANFFGLTGVVLAAPVLATVKLVIDYCMRKMLDQDPWKDMKFRTAPTVPPLFKQVQKIWKSIVSRFKNRSQPHTGN